MSKKWEKCEGCGTAINYGDSYGSVRYCDSLVLPGKVRGEYVFCESCTDEKRFMVQEGKEYKIYSMGEVTSSTIKR